MVSRSGLKIENWHADRHFVRKNGTTTGHLHTLSCEIEGCDNAVSLDPRLVREERAKQLEGWTVARGEVHCPEHSGESPWLPERRESDRWS
jgi:hypothetical protein